MGDGGAIARWGRQRQQIQRVGEQRVRGGKNQGASNWKVRHNQQARGVKRGM